MNTSNTVIFGNGVTLTLTETATHVVVSNGDKWGKYLNEQGALSRVAQGLAVGMKTYYNWVKWS